MLAPIPAPLMAAAPLSVLIVLFLTVCAILAFWIVAQPTQPEAILVQELRAVLARIEAAGGTPAEADRAELARLLDHAHKLKVEAGVVRAGDAILQAG